MPPCHGGRRPADRLGRQAAAGNIPPLPRYGSATEHRPGRPLRVRERGRRMQARKSTSAIRRAGARGSRIRLLAAATACLALAPFLTGCDEPQASPARAPAEAAPAALPDRHAEAARAVEEQVRARFGEAPGLRLRAVQVYRQALADTVAVCGQASRSSSSTDPFIPYVAVVALGDSGPGRVELHLAASTPEATRVYFELVDRCFEGGGPLARRARVAALPPAPRELPRSIEAEPVAAVTPGPPPPMAYATVTTTSRHGVNIRAQPDGTSEVLFVMPRNSTVQVFAEAVGGWLQIGGSEPVGWLHSSMLSRD